MIKFDLTEDELVRLWCQGIRARKILKDAVLEDNPSGIAFAAGWLDYILDALADAAPQDLRPTGNEVDKP